MGVVAGDMSGAINYRCGGEPVGDYFWSQQGVDCICRCTRVALDPT